MARDNFNLDNSFVILLKDRVMTMEQLTVVMIRWFIINAPVLLITMIISIIAAITAPHLAVMILLILAINGFNIFQAIQYIYQPEKDRLHDIVYNDFYTTHKVNSEILLQDIQSADYRMGQISMIISTVRATVVFNGLIAIMMVILAIIL